MICKLQLTCTFYNLPRIVYSVFAIIFWFVLLAYFAQFCSSTFRHVASFWKLSWDLSEKQKKEKNESQIFKILLRGGCGLFISSIW